jgi:U1 small nuclear ribonucleoprotein
MVNDTITGKAKGYAFVEFKHEDDMKKAYRMSTGVKIDGRRIVVDCERGRTVTEWKPRKLGGGLGSTRAIGARPYQERTSGRDDYRSSGVRRPSDRDDHRGGRDDYRRESRDRRDGGGRQDDRRESRYDSRDSRPQYGGDRDRRSYGSSRYDDRR